jgi:hypothetical protein
MGLLEVGVVLQQCIQSFALKCRELAPKARYMGLCLLCAVNINIPMNSPLSSGRSPTRVRGS